MIKLREYQSQAVRAIDKWLLNHVTALLVMATGMGKTITIAWWANKHIKVGKKALVLCHDSNILEQAMKEFRKVMGDEPRFGLFTGEEHANWKEVNILFATLQSMNKHRHEFPIDLFDIVIVDESHHGQAPTFKEAISHFRPRYLVGMTGTPDRMDEQNIREIFGDEVVNIPLEKAIAEGWIPRFEYFVMTDNLDEDVLNRLVRDEADAERRVSLKDINENIFIQMRDERVAEEIIKHNKKTIIFCESIRHIHHFMPFLPGSACVHSGQTTEQNRVVLADFRSNGLQYVLAVNKLNEGIDIPDAELLVFYRATNSNIVFRQQLGRGTRGTMPVVLDFAANVYRVMAIKKMVEDINHHLKESGTRQTPEVLNLEGKNFKFHFTPDQINLLDYIEKISVPFYPTWQEASKVAIAAGVKNQEDYKARYREIDPRLPSSPRETYPDFPGLDVFLGKPEPVKLYPTWQEASKVAIAAGVKDSDDYKARHHEIDPRLPSYDTLRKYPGFPGIDVFFGKPEPVKLYPTWQEASKVAIAAGVKGKDDYKARYKEIDPRLPSHATLRKYPDFPGLDVFLGKQGFYPTWQEASKVAIAAGVKDVDDYKARYREIDPRLPSYTTLRKYPGFPGFDVFLGKLGLYPTWQEASKVAIAAGVKDSDDYKARYKEIDPRLPSQGNLYKYPGFPGLDVFLGKPEPVKLYPTWQEASKVAIAAGVKDVDDYKARYREIDPRLPSYTTLRKYPGFPGLDVFLGKSK